MNNSFLIFGRRFISALTAFVMANAPFGAGGAVSGGNISQAEKSTYTVTVGEKGDYKTLSEARDYVRTLDKSLYDGIDVVIESGIYELREAFVLSEEDSGSENCTIRYIGEDTTITGGISFDSSAFSEAKGEITQYFKEEVKDNIVALDLKQFGYTEDDIKAMYQNPETGKTVHKIDSLIPHIYVNGELATVARYPNDGYVHFETGKIMSPNGESDAIDFVTNTEIVLSEEDAAVVASWHDLSKVFVKGRFSVLWCSDDSRIISLNDNVLTVPFAGGHDPRDGLVLHFENIPEELDAPNEYYVDDDAVLYLVKCDNFEEASFTIPYTETIISVDGADYITFENLVIESADGNIITANADNLTLKECEIRDSGEKIKLYGNNILVDSCVFHDFSKAVLDIGGGDTETLVSSENVVTNCEFYSWALVEKVYNAAISLSGVGVTVSHNSLHDSTHMAIGWGGNYHVVEYNEIYDVCTDTDDAAAIYSYSSYADYGNVFRYNYIHDLGLQDASLKNIKSYTYCYVSGIYFDGGKSGQTAYGNVLENITGPGIIASGRDEVVTNNLFISCGYGVDMSAWYYALGQSAGGKSGQNFDHYENNEIWKQAFPGLFDLVWEIDDMEDPNCYIAPAGNVCKNNYYYLDKVTNSTMRSYGHMYSTVINAAVIKFSGENIEEVKEGVNQTTYSSKRTELTAAAAVEATQNITGITPEIFDQIGLVK